MVARAKRGICPRSGLSFPLSRLPTYNTRAKRGLLMIHDDRYKRETAALGRFIRRVWVSDDYLPVSALRHGWGYQIFGRNAFAGVWHGGREEFLIARYDYGDTPYLAPETHWDQKLSETPFRPGVYTMGTVKPLKAIGPCPHAIDGTGRHPWELLEWLQALERDHPVVPGIDTVMHRQYAALSFQAYMEHRRAKPSKKTPVWKIVKGEK